MISERAAVLRTACLPSKQILEMCRDAPRDLLSELFRLHLAKLIVELDDEVERIQPNTTEFVVNRAHRSVALMDIGGCFDDPADAVKLIDLVGELARVQPPTGALN